MELSKQEAAQLEWFDNTRSLRELLTSPVGKTLLTYLKERYFSETPFQPGSFDKTAFILGQQEVVNHLVWLTAVQLKEGLRGG